ncbi:hypothetical protein BGW42_000343 [Actinomortierella wolfii]|nr:hypothetical protein BGW42_000343 [Actinomortierella wolfii]
MSTQRVSTPAPATIPVMETPLTKTNATMPQQPQQPTPASIEPSAAQRMISACAGSLVTSLLVTPLDVVKTRLQSQTVVATPTCAKPFSFSSNASAYEKLCQCCREVFFAAPEALGSAGVRQNNNMTNLLSASSSISASISQRIRPSMSIINHKKPTSTALSDGCGPSISQVHQEGTVVGMKASQAQQQRLERIAAHCIENGHAHRHAQERYFHGTWDGVKKIVKYEGVSSLWRGLSPTLIMSVPATVIYFVGYDYLKVVLADQMKLLDRRRIQMDGREAWPPSPGMTVDRMAIFLSDHRESLGPLVAGGFARTVAATIISPLELFRTRMQSVHTTTKGNTGLFRGVFQGVVTMVRTEGPLSLWRGLAPTLWRDVPFSAIYWFGYEAIKRELLSRQQRQALSTAEGDWRRLNDFEVAFLSGALSGMNAAILTTPFDVAKTRRQVDLNEPAHHRMWPLMRAIVREEGFAGLWRGLTARVAKVAPSCAIMISSYEVGKKALSEHWWGLGTSSSEATSDNSRGSGRGNNEGTSKTGDEGSSSSSSSTGTSTPTPGPASWVLLRDSTTTA